MDMTDAIAPRSDQMNADDLLGDARTFTIREVTQGSSEQPVNVHLVEFPRPWRPSKSMSRVLVTAWGKEAANYAGKKVTLYRDPDITFGRDKVGGIRISHMSGLSQPLTIALTVTRGRRAPYKVDPLPDDAPTTAAVDEGTVARLAELREEWKSADPERKAAIEAEVAALSGGE